MPTREEIAAEVARRRAEALASGMPPAEVAAGEREFSSLPPAEQERLLAESKGSSAQAERPRIRLEGQFKRPPPEPGMFDYLFKNNGSQPSGSYIEQVGAGLSPGGEPPKLSDAPEMAKVAGRAVLREASGGVTENVAKAVAGAGDQAAGEVTAATLSGMTPEQMLRLMQEANPEQQSMTFVRTPGGWVPGTRTDAQGESGKDPRAVSEALRLQGRAEQHGALGLEGQQAADRSRYEGLQQVQQNEMRATQEFKRQHDDMQARYDAERAQQMERLASIQKAMDAVPDAPRTIGEKLKRSGWETKTTFGIAAALSVLGGAMSKDGGASVQRLIQNAQANIDREVQKEADEYARHGERAKMANNIYAHLRQSLQDNQEALNVTKALYYDAAINATKQIATQYQLDMQQPAVSQWMEHLLKERQRLILDTASTMQNQFSQTDKYAPPSTVAVGSKKLQMDSKELAEALGKYGQEIDKRGGNVGERAIEMYQQAMEKMRKAGFANDEKFWNVFASMESADSPKIRAALMAKLDKEQREAMQLIVAAGSEQLLDEAGKTVTANELAREQMKKGGYSIESLDQVRKIAAQKREQIYNSVDGTFGGANNAIGRAYRARKRMSELDRRNPGIGTEARQAVDPEQLSTRIEGRLRK